MENTSFAEFEALQVEMHAEKELNSHTVFVTKRIKMQCLHITEDAEENLILPYKFNT